MGAGELSLWRKRRRRDAVANLRSLLHPALFVETRCHDRSENDLYDVRRKRAIGRPRYQLSVISYQLSVRTVGQARRLPVQGMASGSACPTTKFPRTSHFATVATALRAVRTRLPFDKLRASSETRLQLIENN